MCPRKGVEKSFLSHKERICEDEYVTCIYKYPVGSMYGIFRFTHIWLIFDGKSIKIYNRPMDPIAHCTWPKGK